MEWCGTDLPRVAPAKATHHGADTCPDLRVSPEYVGGQRCHDGPVSWEVAARAAVWPLVPLLLTGAIVIDAATPGDEPSLSGALAAASYLVVTLAPYVVGLFLTLRVPRHGAGWSFLGLATAMAWSAFTEEYALAAVGGDLDLPGGTLMATFADSSFLGWFVFLTPRACTTRRRAARPGSGGCRSSRWPRRSATRSSCCSGPNRSKRRSRAW